MTRIRFAGYHSAIVARKSPAGNEKELVPNNWLDFIIMLYLMQSEGKRLHISFHIFLGHILVTNNSTQFPNQQKKTFNVETSTRSLLYVNRFQNLFIKWRNPPLIPEAAYGVCSLTLQEPLTSWSTSSVEFREELVLPALTHH